MLDWGPYKVINKFHLIPQSFFRRTSRFNAWKTFAIRPRVGDFSRLRIKSNFMFNINSMWLRMSERFATITLQESFTMHPGVQSASKKCLPLICRFLKTSLNISPPQMESDIFCVSLHVVKNIHEKKPATFHPRSEMRSCLPRHPFYIRNTKLFCYSLRLKCYFFGGFMCVYTQHLHTTSAFLGCIFIFTSLRMPQTTVEKHPPTFFRHPHQRHKKAKWQRTRTLGMGRMMAEEWEIKNICVISLEHWNEKFHPKLPSTTHQPGWEKSHHLPRSPFKPRSADSFLKKLLI